MKTKLYKNGTLRCRTYLKKVGHGYETGLIFNGHTAFVGNFTHATEANQWYTLMKREISTFSKRFKVGHHYPKNWFKNFLANHLYACYYRFVDKQLAKHNRAHTTAVKKHQRKYHTISRQWTGHEKKPFLKAA